MENEIFDSATIQTESLTELRKQPAAEKKASDKDFDSYGFYPDASF